MYKEFYGFSEEPFALNPDPKFLYLAPSHYNALASMISGIKERKGLVVITGEVGVGKTILIYALLKDLSEKIKTAFIFHPRLDFESLLQHILRDLDVPIGEGEEKLPSLLLLFNRYVLGRLARDETVTIIIDEAQTMEERVLENLGRLSSPGTPAGRLVQTLLVGQPELEVKLNSEKLRSLKKRVAIQCQINPLTREEGRAYVKHRLGLVGRDLTDVFTLEAVNRVWEFAHGVPRVINLLCDRALLIGYSKSSPIIDSEIVKEAIKDFEYLRPPKPGILRPVLPSLKFPYRTSYLFIFLLFLFFIGLGVFFLLDRHSAPPAVRVKGKISPVEEQPVREGEEKFLKEEKEERIVEVKEGWTLSSVARQYYPVVNTSLLDFILEANPQIKDLNLIFPRQKIKIPRIGEDSLLVRIAEGMYGIHLGSFRSPQEVRLYKEDSFFKGKKVRVEPRRVSPRETWYRVVLGEFSTEEEALRFIQVLKEKKLLPIVDCLPRGNL